MTIRALIVDDEPWARKRLASLLKAEKDFQIVGECADGEAAVNAVRETPPDVVFLDVQMPGVDGFEVLEAIEKRRPPQIVFVTAYDEYAVRTFEVHAVDYLLKPFDEARFTLPAFITSSFSLHGRTLEFLAITCFEFSSYLSL